VWISTRKITSNFVVLPEKQFENFSNMGLNNMVNQYVAGARVAEVGEIDPQIT